MFNFTTTLSYGLRLLINLAQSDKGPRQLRKIAHEENISLPYLRKIILPLDKAGIVRSTRGPGGGFVLNRDPKDIALSEIIGILSHNKVIDCVKGYNSCRRFNGCRVKDLLEEAYDKFQLVFQGKTLESISKEAKS
ncbi:MAG: Rrf2 family transcriptional regulator [Candidatus Omnitrophica bacterium]|nr:Rrf2 family transcriptional regulator [Candidatus Omnitrophota bacterium]